MDKIVSGQWRFSQKYIGPSISHRVLRILVTIQNVASEKTHKTTFGPSRVSRGGRVMGKDGEGHGIKGLVSWFKGKGDQLIKGATPGDVTAKYEFGRKVGSGGYARSSFGARSPGPRMCCVYTSRFEPCFVSRMHSGRHPAYLVWQPCRCALDLGDEGLHPWS